MLTPTSTDTVNAPSLADKLANAHQIVSEIESKLGLNPPLSNSP